MGLEWDSSGTRVGLARSMDLFPRSRVFCPCWVQVAVVDFFPTLFLSKKQIMSNSNIKQKHAHQQTIDTCSLSFRDCVEYGCNVLFLSGIVSSTAAMLGTYPVYLCASSRETDCTHIHIYITSKQFKPLSLTCIFIPRRIHSTPPPPKYKYLYSRVCFYSMCTRAVRSREKTL